MHERGGIPQLDKYLLFLHTIAYNKSTDKIGPLLNKFSLNLLN